MNRQILLCTIQVALVASIAVAEVINRIVTDDVGRPIRGVNVSILTTTGSKTTTDETGRIDVSYSGGPVLVEHPDYSPIFMRFTIDQQEPLAIVLKPRVGLEWKIPSCSGSNSKRQGKLEALANLELTRSKKLMLHTSEDSDYLLVRMIHRRSKSELRHWKRTVSAGIPSSTWFKNVTKFITRPVSLAGTRGYDVRGTAESGKLSRWVGVFYTFVEYTAVDPSVAKEFDEVIDKLCFEWEK
jgi:hypothetical protein